MLDRIKAMNIMNDPSSTNARLGFEASHEEFYAPPTSHLVATVEDLTDMLDYASEEANDMDEDGEAIAHTATPTTGQWTATST